MTSKGAITISHDELIRMKMRANLIPNRITSPIQLINKTILQLFNISKAKNELISGLIIPKILKKGKKKKDIKSLKRNSSKGEKQMNKSDFSSRKKSKKSQQQPTLNSSKTQRRSELLTVNSFTLILSKVENNKWRSKSISRTLKRKDNNFITRKPWY